MILLGFQNSKHTKMPVTSKVHQDPDGSGKVTGYDVLMEDTTRLAGPQAVKDQNASRLHRVF